ncbi:MAG: AAA family ATPase [Thermostichales cyanobacterium HHBFW_bins_127]
MQIVSVRLKNFKIHQDRHFDFAPGINAICGENGAGKTSILEAIAWVLFDYSDYKQEELIRTGCSQAEVAVQFISDYDGRTYEVRRSVTAKSSYYRLYDPALNHQLEYEKKEDVERWLKQHLRISPETNLPQLFRTAIGVPQGTLTLDFLKSPSERKKVFDAMIKVEEYKATAEHLKDLERYAQDQITSSQHQIELLQVELKQRDLYSQRLAQVNATMEAQQQQLEVARQQQQVLEQEWQQLSQLLEQIRHREAQWQQQRQELAVAEVRLNQARQQLEQAQAAQATLAACREDFERYQTLEAEASALQKQLQSRQELHRQRDQILAVERTLEQDCTRLELQLQRWQSLAAQLPQLQQQAQTQREKEAQLATLQQEQQIHQQLKQNIQLTQTQLQGSRQQGEQVEQGLREAEGAVAELQRQQPGYEQYRQAQQALATIQGQRQRREQVRQHWQELRERLSEQRQQEARLQAQYQRRQELVQLMQELEGQVQQQQQWEQRLQELQERLQQGQILRQRLQDHEQRRNQLQQEHTQLQQHLEALRELLPQVASIPQLEAEQERLRSQLSRWQAARQFAGELKQILSSAQQQQQTLAAQRSTWQTLLTHHPDLAHWIQQTWQTLDTTLASLAQILKAIQAQSDPEHLQAQLEAIHKRLDQAYQARQHTAPLEDYQRRQQNLTQELHQLQETIADLHWHLDGDTTTRHHYQELQTHLQTLGDPRSHLARCRQEYASSADLEQQWHHLQTHLQHTQGSLTALEQELAAFGDLEQQEQQWQQVLQASQPSYQAYLQAQALAATLTERRQQWQHLQAQIQHLESQLSQLHQQLEQHQHRWGSSLEEVIATQQAELQALGDPRRQVEQIEEELQGRPQVEEQYAGLQQQRLQTQQQRQQLEAALQATVHLEPALQEIQEQLHRCRPGYTRYLQAKPHADHLPQAQQQQHQTEQVFLQLQQRSQALEAELQQLQGRFDPQHYQALEQQRRELAVQIARLETSLAALSPQRQELLERLADLEQRQQDLQQQINRQQRQQDLYQLIKVMRGIYRDAGPRLAELYLQSINQTADQLFREILNRPDVGLTWTADYDIVVQEGASRRRFAMLSGGEQMSAALAVRLALLKTIEEVSIAFFDEPTTNMDQQRRRNLAESLGRIRSFEQLFVISHDDSFENLSGHIIDVTRS